MSYKVVSFSARVNNRGTSADVAKQVESSILQEASAGWEFVSCGNVDTIIEGSNGCFGLGAKPAVSTSVMVLVFRQ